MVVGALTAQKPAFGDAFLELMKNYGTILAGIPVLVAVVVAKQQLDANRRQHVATVKRGFKDQIDALIAVQKLSSHVSNGSYSENTRPGTHEGMFHFNYWHITDRTKAMLRLHFEESLLEILSMLEDALSALSRAEWYQTSTPEEVVRCFDLVQATASILNIRLDREMSDLSQYWS